MQILFPLFLYYEQFWNNQKIVILKSK